MLYFFTLQNESWFTASAMRSVCVTWIWCFTNASSALLRCSHSCRTMFLLALLISRGVCMREAWTSVVMIVFRMRIVNLPVSQYQQPHTHTQQSHTAMSATRNLDLIPQSPSQCHCRHLSSALCFRYALWPCLLSTLFFLSSCLWPTRRPWTLSVCHFPFILSFLFCFCVLSSPRLSLP